MAGVDLSLVPIHHQYVVTAKVPALERLEREFPVLRDLEGSYYMRQERDGLLLGPYESVHSMRTCDQWVRQGRVPDSWRGGRELFEPDADRLHEHLERAMEMVPALRDAPIRRIISGPICYSPEAAPLLGPFSPLRHYWLMAGFGFVLSHVQYSTVQYFARPHLLYITVQISLLRACSYGIIQAGGAGKYIADWIVDGEPPFDLIEVDANRFGSWCTAYVINRLWASRTLSTSGSV